jgi:hypothetical protein
MQHNFMRLQCTPRREWKENEEEKRGGGLKGGEEKKVQRDAMCNHVPQASYNTALSSLRSLELHPLLLRVLCIYINASFPPTLSFSVATER